MIQALPGFNSVPKLGDLFNLGTVANSLEGAYSATGFRRQKVRGRGRGRAARAPKGKHVGVVGGGIAGLAAATVLAERGVQVTVFDQERFLGGRAGAWSDVLADGTRFQMERGFHGFFRQYYNLRRLLQRVDPDLGMLVPLTDYPLLGPNGATETFVDLPKVPPFNMAELVRRSNNLETRDLKDVAFRPALAMVSYDEATTYARYDDRTAREYLDSLRFPEHARRMLFDVFSHSFFNPEERYSAAELLMNFHFYFVGNPEGLVFDVVNDPFSSSIFEPLSDYLERRGSRFRLGESVERITPLDGGGFRLEAAESLDVDAVVLAVNVPGLKKLVAASEQLGSPQWREDVGSLAVTDPFAVHRLWLDTPVGPSRAAFAGTTGVGLLDNISVYERFEAESAKWAAQTGGSVVELHAYAVPPGTHEAAVRAELVSTLHMLYPETRQAKILEERFFVRSDCPAFEPGSYARRPGIETGQKGLTIAGDFVKLPFPTALMERAASSGMLAANRFLADWGVREETLFSVPTRGMLAPLRRFAA